MIFLYNLSILALRGVFSFASTFHTKAEAFVKGRSGLFKKLKDDFRTNTQPVIWIHCASLGEFEQGRPVLEAMKQQWPKYKILLTFFSPSGYEVRKNYAMADHIYYLPWDTHRHAVQFINLTKPVLAIFVKYEFWYHYTAVLHKQGIPLLSISSIFRNDQLFFQSYGGFYRRILKNFTHFFVQNDASKRLLQSINITQVDVAGDTRFDRVVTLTHQQAALPIVEKFKDNQSTWVIGSCWAEDLEVLTPFINEKKLKFILAPHEIHEAILKYIETLLQVKHIRYSQANENTVGDYDVLIIDNIGMLSKLYRYGEFAYVGGAFGKGLHNILEPCCYGIPVFFGNRKYEKFQEAMDLIMRGGAFTVGSYTDLRAEYETLVSRPENYVLACEVNSQYVQENLGATEKIISYCQKLLPA